MMNKQAITRLLNEHYESFANYIATLPESDFVYQHNDKWTAGQQLAHIVLCVKPLVQVFSLDAAAVEQNFGKTDRQGRSYEALKAAYQEKLAAGGKAPERFLPAPVSVAERAELIASLLKLITALNAKIELFPEADLDQLCVPHPLLGNLTMREMLYNAAFHVVHHQQMAQQYLHHKP